MFEPVVYAVAIAATAASATGPTEPVEALEAVEMQAVRGTRAPIAATNTLFGPTGLIVVPTAYTAGARQAQFSASFANELRGPAINYGLIPYVEIGGAFIDREGMDNKLIGNAKVTIIPANFEFFEVGVGIIDVADAIDQSWYVVGSADFAVPPFAENGVRFRAHAGVGTGMFRERLIGGAELQLDNRFSILGEWDASNFNGALKYTHGDFRLQVGFQHARLFLGATHVLDFSR